LNEVDEEPSRSQASDLFGGPVAPTVPNGAADLGGALWAIFLFPEGTHKLLKEMLL
jgi:hypothetical protein